MTFTAGLVLQGLSFRVNSPVQPIPGVVLSPNYYDFYSTIFERYIAKGAKIKATLSNPSTIPLAVVMCPVGDVAVGLTTL